MEWPTRRYVRVQRDNCSLSPDDQVDVDTGVDAEVGDLLDDAGGAVDVDNSLVNAHFVAVERVGTITARRTARGDSEHLGGDAHDTAGLVALLLGAGDDLGAGVLKRLGFTATEGHSDSLDFFLDFFSLGLVLLYVHFH